MFCVYSASVCERFLKSARGKSFFATSIKRRLKAGSGIEKKASLAAGKPELREKISHWYNELFEELRKADCPDALNMVLLLEGLFYLRHFHVDATIDGEIERLLERMSQSL